MSGRARRLAVRWLVTGLMACLAGDWQLAASTSQESTRHQVTGMVLSIDVAQRTLLVSHDAIEGVMGPMAMTFEVRDAAELAGLTPGMAVRFTLVRTAGTAHAEGIVVVPYDSVELDPMVARRLRLLEALVGAPRPAPLAVGAAVPDFTLTDQTGARVSLSQLRGQVVVVNFIYTSCALTQFCFRVANHFASIAHRFEDRLGKDLTLLTVTFDPARDTVDVLREYASQWKVAPGTWKFLTGEVDDVRRVCEVFGVDFYPDEGLMNHSLRTAVIDRTGRLAGRIEGNEYTAAQLGDLVADALRR
jgi:protein SCO1/2